MRGAGALALALLLGAPAARADSEDVIDVFGERPEASRPDRPGQTLILRPTDPTRLDTTTQLHQEASLAVPETGRITASGFAVPRVRGEDARFTEVFVEGMLLQDPFSGLPLVDEVDLRAFGELVVHEGVPPPELATVNPIGIMEYRVTKAKGDAQVGITAGQPYGASAWALQNVDGPWLFRVYARRHETDGKYRYYDDNGTPYNTSDDSYKIRQNNQRQSNELVPVAAGHLAGGRLTTLALLQTSTNGIPSLTGQDSEAEAKATTLLAVARYARELGASLVLAVDAGVNHDERAAADPSHQVVGPQGAASLKVDGTRLGTQLTGGPAQARLSVGADLATAHVQTDTATARRSDDGYVAAVLAPIPAITLELKALGRWVDDTAAGSAQTDSLTPAGAASRRLFLPGETAAALWRQGWLEAYAQTALASRGPSLMEEFGDGELVRANPAIGPERSTHRELGLTAKPAVGAGARIGVAAFQDDTLDRIVLLPSLAQSLRAENIGVTRIQGAELRASMTAAATRLYLTATRLWPEDLSDPARVTVLPGVAEEQAALGVEQRFGRTAWRWDARYRSQIYRDVANQIVVPGTWIHDASADTHVALGGNELGLGLAVLNVLDVEKLPVAAPATPANQGETAYEDSDGYPLPGRQWRFSVTLAF